MDGGFGEASRRLNEISEEKERKRKAVVFV
jgi:hypothetical protein